MAIFWTEASESVLSTARELIAEHHAELENARIGFMFRSEPAVSMGYPVYAKTSVVSKQMKALIEFDFLIWVHDISWGQWDERRRKALIDHELCHCVASEVQDHPGVYEFSLRGHEIEEFPEIIERYGFWSLPLILHGERMKGALQNALPGIIEVKGFVGAVPVEKLGAVDPGLKTGASEDARELLDRAREDPEAVMAQLVREADALRKENGGEITVSQLQRKLRVGYTKAAKIKEFLDEVGA